MAEHKAMSALIGLAPNAALEADMKQPFRWFIHWHNDAAVAGTTAIAEQVGHTCKTKGRVIAARIVTNAAVTANGTNFFTLLVDKRTAAAPGTPVNQFTFAADTPTTDDIAAWTNKDLMAYKTSTDADLDVAAGDVLTFEVTKTGGSGLAFPNAFVEIIFESRD